MTNEKIRILVVDDSPNNLRLLSHILKNQPYDLTLMRDAKSALSSAQDDPPDLILLDIKMPHMSGYEACERLKDNERTRDVPVIFISALAETEDKVKAFSHGGVDYITKPFQPGEVRARVHTHLTLWRLRKELKEQNAKLKEALANIKTLKGLLPICAKCKKIRDDNGYWNRLECYIQKHSEAFFTHGICPQCAKALYDVEI